MKHMDARREIKLMMVLAKGATRVLKNFRRTMARRDRRAADVLIEALRRAVQERKVAK